jgi:hypothetical protein
MDRRTAKNTFTRPFVRDKSLIGNDFLSARFANVLVKGGERTAAIGGFRLSPIS